MSKENISDIEGNYNVTSLMPGSSGFHGCVGRGQINCVAADKQSWDLV